MPKANILGTIIKTNTDENVNQLEVEQYKMKLIEATDIKQAVLFGKYVVKNTFTTWCVAYFDGLNNEQTSSLGIKYSHVTTINK